MKKLDIGTTEQSSTSPVHFEINFEKNVDLVPTGSTLLNLALSNNPYGGYKKGSIVQLKGATDTGKTVVGMNLFAEVAYDESFKDYRLIYDEPECKNDLPIGKFFGATTEERLEMDNPSEIIEDLNDTLHDLFKKKENFIYLLDSFDSLDDEEAREKILLERNYDNKPRLASTMFRKVKGKIKSSKSLLVVISQLRDKIGAKFGKKTRTAGGRAIPHNCTHIIEFTYMSAIKRKDIKVGVHVRVNIDKNHYNGNKRDFELDILNDYGVDNVGSMVDWMVQKGFWKKSKQTINTGGDFIDATREKLCNDIINEDSGEDKLIQIVAECWTKLEDSVKTERKPRYA